MSVNDTIREQMLRYLDGTLSETGTRELNEHLQSAPELRREFAELLRQQMQLAEVGTELAEKIVPLSPVADLSRRRHWLALAACLAVFAAAGFWLTHRPVPEGPLRFARVNGEVWVERGDVKRRATTSVTLRPGDKVQTHFGAAASIEFIHEATRLDLREETTLLLPMTGRQQFTLEQGALAAKVAPQPPGAPLIFRTPQGDAKILGTEFLLASDAGATHLTVTEGRVELRRHSDGAAVQVAALQTAVAAEDVPLTVRAVPEEGKGTGLLGEYFPGRQFERPHLRRLDSRVQFDWDIGPPVPGVNIDHFQVRWTGAVQPRFSERYTFEMVADDGVRLWVDGQLLIDQWDIRNRQTKMRGEIVLVAGRKHDLKLEYFESSGRAFVSLYWQSDSQAREVIPQSQLYPASK